jgi:hypothetical protein
MLGNLGLTLPAKKASKPTPYARLIGCGKNGHISFQSLVLGCPPKWNMRDERRILRFIKQNTQMEWKDVMKGLVVDFSKDTVKRILKKHNITKWITTKRPKITPEIAILRLNFARKLPTLAASMTPRNLVR